MAIKNFWSLNVDEAILAGKLKKELGKDFELFFPVNSQLKDIDLIVYNLKTRKSLSIQVKGSRTYHPKRSEKVNGHTSCWNVVKNKKVVKVNNIPFKHIDFSKYLNNWSLIR